jgi:nicotinamide-nucleotide amidase
MRIAIVATGDELLTGELVDTNSAWLSEQLFRSGVVPAFHRTIGDDLDAIRGAIREIAAVCDAAVFSGGLGPTDDDLTVEAVARVLGVEVVTHEESLARARHLLEKHGIAFTENNARQAMVPAGSTVLMNPAGLAPGFHVTLDGCDLWFLPGVPGEFKALCDQDVLPALRAATAGEGAFAYRIFKMGAVPESHLARAVEPLVARYPGVRFGYRAHYPEVWFKALVRAEEPPCAAAVMTDISRSLVGTFGDRIIGTDDETIAEVVVKILRGRGLTLTTAESCTGGLAGGLLTAVPGASEVYLGGAVTYSNALKARILGVSEAILEEEGAVSEACARAMAEGARDRLGSDLGVAITGITGPDGGTAEKPVGTVHFALATPTGTLHKQRRFFPPREMIRRGAAWAALDMVRLWLLAPPPDAPSL